ncbi:glucan endo-1,3-beta-glucosidase-like [Rhodamnia argentea]|uniref:glucan endo-1,3-beta-D-glucosidase n=1 Tax=Rhodamnia argentea TaxID=178133 RepID=A0A8B8P523_9MYRT|nr:glucan endo-1,3-beta-glucosidase-like [Rhodamnia argentea]
MSTQVLNFSGAYDIGINYGFNGDNLPSPAAVVDLLRASQISYVRLFEPRKDVLDSFRGKPFVISLGTRNEDIKNLASSPGAALAWIESNVSPFVNDVNIGYITIGNEVIPGAEALYIAQAIDNMLAAISAAGITRTIKVSTVVSMNVLGSSYPPSNGAFSSPTALAMKGIVPLLVRQGAPLMLNVYPYFTYASDPQHISLEFALFQSKVPAVRDGNLEYYNLFDAMVDAVFVALEKINAPGLSIAIGETGWPSAGNPPHTTTDNARTYNKNFMDHVLNRTGTPRRPGMAMEAFFFELFNEDEKAGGVEQNFGFFYPNTRPVYPFWPGS